MHLWSMEKPSGFTFCPEVTRVWIAFRTKDTHCLRGGREVELRATKTDLETVHCRNDSDCEVLRNSSPACCTYAEGLISICLSASSRLLLLLLLPLSPPPAPESHGAWLGKVVSNTSVQAALLPPTPGILLDCKAT